MNFDSDQEKKLDAFLKKYNPAPPHAKPGEYQRILRTLEEGNKSFWPSLKWLVPVGAMAILTFVFWTPPTSKYDPEVNEALAMIVGPLPSAMNEGIEGDWLALAETVSQRAQ